MTTVMSKTLNKFNLDFRIGIAGASLPALMDCVQETSLLHTHSIKGAMDYYDEMGWVWVLTHWQVEVCSYPKLGEHINIATWPVGFKGYFGTRGYEARNAENADNDENSNFILKANSNWMLLDRNTLKPVRPTEYILNKYGECFDFPITKDFSMPSLQGTDGFDLLSTHSYIPSRRDIDTNNHVNNISYVRWLYDFIPEDLYLNCRPSALKVAYKKETRAGDDLTIKLYKRRLADLGENNTEILAIIEKDGKIATEIYTVWQGE